VVLSDTAAVAPDHYYFREDRADCLIDGEYFCGAPDLITEVLSPASRAIDRGPRQELYRRSGVTHFWLLDPETETVETCELVDRVYQLTGTYRAGERFEPVLFPGEAVAVEDLFKTQSKRNHWPPAAHTPAPIPEWIITPDARLGLEYFFLLGHPEHRWEIWGNRGPSVLAFGSPAEASTRLRHFLREACQWEGLDGAKPTSLGPDTEQAEVGRFKFTRAGRHIHLDVAVDARKYRELVTVWHKKDTWDWGGA
jgi:hypothetical protein